MISVSFRTIFATVSSFKVLLSFPSDRAMPISDCLCLLFVCICSFFCFCCVFSRSLFCWCFICYDIFIFHHIVINDNSLYICNDIVIFYFSSAFRAELTSAWNVCISRNTFFNAFDLFDVLFIRNNSFLIFFD